MHPGVSCKRPHITATLNNLRLCGGERGLHSLADLPLLVRCWLVLIWASLGVDSDVLPLAVHKINNTEVWPWTVDLLIPFTVVRPTAHTLSAPPCVLCPAADGVPARG